jgi:hypothetical protein
MNLGTLTAAIIRILRPLVRIMLRNGMSFAAFCNIAKWVYVDTAAREFGLNGRTSSTSRISVITGLSRKEVKRVRDEAHPQDNSLSDRYSRAARVIAAWRREGDYTDESGNPLILALTGEEPSFAGLVRKFSGDMPFRAVLDELTRAGTAEKTMENGIRLINRSYIPGQDDEMCLHILGTDTAHLVSTIDHNMKAGPSSRFFQRKVSYDNLPGEILPVFHELAGHSSQRLLEDLDKWLSNYDRDLLPETKGGGGHLAGIGIYYFEEPVDEKV